MQQHLQLIWDGLLDLVYPPRCLVCERPYRPPLCEACHAHFVPLGEPVCAVCGRPMESEASGCRPCEAAEKGGGWGFDTARAAAVYQGPLRHAIHRFKYGRAASLGLPLGAYLANRAVADGLVFFPIDLVVPVPMHAQRERRRGFNQAVLLAREVAALSGVPLAPTALRRVRKTAAQVGLSTDRRRANLSAGVFSVPDPAVVAGKRVLLIDDVFTTGATVSACARALKAAGAGEVHVLTLAAGG